jgi:glycosyltransferase involved in cell wall biosynthesis
MSKKKSILILNWKDIKNPLSGGAEILTHEMAKGFKKNGFNVIMFVSTFKGASNKEIIDGIQIVRSGEPDIRYLYNSVHYKAYKYYKSNLQGKVSIIIDEVHGVPFFARFYAKEKVIALTCEVAGNIWFKMFSFPWNILGWVSERTYLILYKKVPTLTISESTKKELISCGISAKNITVLPMGFNRVAVKNIKKEKNPTIIFVGRLNKMKGVEDAIKAAAILKKRVKKLQFWIVGRGDSEFIAYLKKIVEHENLLGTVKFLDYVTEEKKFELMARAHAIVVPSVREGFGLIVPEAGSVGTPAVVYDVHGLKDTVRNGVNGYVVPVSISDLMKGIENIFANDKKYHSMCISAKKESDFYKWENTTKIALKAIQN